MIMLNGNPASRLLDVITAARKIPSTTSTLKAWAQLFDSGDDVALMYERIACLMRLTRETFASMNELFPRQENATKKWKRSIDSAFKQQNLLGTFESFTAQIDDNAIDHLIAAADLLESKNPIILSSEEIINYTNQINSLVSEVLAGELEEKVKEFLVRSLQKILLAIQEYRLSGAIPVTDAIDQMVGRSFHDKSYYESLQKTKIGEKIRVVLADLANAVTVSTPAVQALLAATAKTSLGVDD